jgi:hypothetical protein
MRLASAFAVVLAAASSGCINVWAAYEDPQYTGGSGRPRPEPSLSESVEGMSLQTYFVISGQRDRFAVRRCVHVDGSVERCEITIVGQRAVLARVPTYRRGTEEWEAQAEDAQDAVEEVIEDKLGDERVALTRLGTFGSRQPEEGSVSLQLEAGRLKLTVSGSGKPEVVYEVEAPPGVTVVEERYVSERAPSLFAFTLAGPEQYRDRNNGFVAFRRVAPRSYELVAWLPPLEPNPSRGEAAPAPAPPSP